MCSKASAASLASRAAFSTGAAPPGCTPSFASASNIAFLSAMGEMCAALNGTGIRSGFASGVCRFRSLFWSNARSASALTHRDSKAGGVQMVMTAFEASSSVLMTSMNVSMGSSR